MKLTYQLFAKKLILSILTVLLSMLSFAATYYVSSKGSDANSGLTAELAWKTLVKVNAAKFIAGDQILFQKGDTFYGSLMVKNSGSFGNPITFGAYGNGSSPIISGFTTVTAWTNLGSNIWESTSAVSTLSTCNMVVINGVNTAMGRYPNSDATNGGYLTFQSHSGTTSITSSSINGTPNWTNAELVLRSSLSTIDRLAIINQSGGTLTYGPTLTYGYGVSYTPINGYGFFIQNDSKTLDQQNEWYFNPSTKKISIYSTSMPQDVKVASVIDLVTFSYPANYIVIDGIDFQGANRNGFYTNSTHTQTIKNCSISYCGEDGIRFSGCHHFTFDNNTVKDINNTAVDLFSLSTTYSLITNNTIINTGIIPGMGVNANFGGYVGIHSASDNITIINNNIINTGSCGIVFFGGSTLVENNLIDTSCTILQDGGGIYMIRYPNDPVVTGQQIIGNIILNSVGCSEGTNDLSYKLARGIYLDDRCRNVKIIGNTVANCASDGIFIMNSSFIEISNNTCYNNESQFRTQDGIENDDITNCVINNNKFISKTKSQNVVQMVSLGAKLPDMGTFDYNYYARPIDDNIVFILRPESWSTPIYNYNLSVWKTYMGQDQNSKKSPQSITNENDLQFEYNATKTAKTITLSQPMIDVKGTKYATSVTLQPYTSVVLMKDAKPTKYSTEYKSICDGLSYNGWTLTGKYERTLVAKSGADSIVTTYLTVNPKYTVQENVTILSGETYNGWNTPGTYTRTLTSVSGCDSVITTILTVDISTVKVVTTQTILLKKGNNMTSTYLQATNPDVSLVTKTIRDSGNLIKMQNESGSSYENWGILGGWINNMGSIQKTEGYKITVANDCVLQVTGTQIDLPLNIALNVGWNIISFPRADILDAKMLIQSLIDQNALVKVQDEIGNSIEDWGVFGGWKNGIGNFLPGKAYRLKVSKSAVLTIQESYPKSIAIPVYAEQTQHFNSIVEGNGSDHMNINLVGLNKSGLSAGDELAAFDGDLCVGTLKITDQHLLESAACLIASCSTNDLNNDGFKEGSSIQLKLWNQVSGEESKVQVSILNGSPTYLKNATMLGKLKSQTTSVANFEEMTQIEVYPNPTQGRFSVRFSDLPISGSRIDVLDLSGRKIASRLITAITEEFDITGKSAGMYLVKSILGGKEKIEKIVIQ